jgi:hypothetical protein
MDGRLDGVNWIRPQQKKKKKKKKGKMEENADNKTETETEKDLKIEDLFKTILSSKPDKMASIVANFKTTAPSTLPSRATGRDSRSSVPVSPSFSLVFLGSM